MASFALLVALLATAQVDGDVVVKRIFGQSNEDGSASSLRNDGSKILLYSIVFSSVGLFVFLVIVTKLCVAVLQRRKFNNSSVKPAASLTNEDETQLVMEKESEEAKDGGKLDDSVRPKRKIRIKLGKSGTSFSTHHHDHQELPPLVMKGSMNV